MSSGIFALFALYLLFGLFLVGIFTIPLIILIYNRFVALRTSIEAAWSDIDVLLRKRIDLLSSLVEAVKGYADHERALFRQVTALRAELRQGVETVPEHTGEREMRGLFHALFAVSENYPQLKADRTFMDLQNAISETEDRIEISRRDYNQSVRMYNIRRQAFPSNLVAKLFHFETAEFFEIEKGDAKHSYSLELNTN